MRDRLRKSMNYRNHFIYSSNLMSGCAINTAQLWKFGFKMGGDC